MTENILEIKNLIVGFSTSDKKFPVKDLEETAQEDLIAVKGVTLTLAKGETLALVGESGCGKTVLCKSILKLLCEKGSIRRGEILFHGKDLAPLSQREMRAYRGSRIAMVFQDPASVLDPAFSVGEQIVEALRLHKGLTRKAAVSCAVELMEKVKIADATDRFYQRPYQFSGGMRQRIAIAMALAGEPEILIADEPTTALDERTQREVLKLLKSVQLETGAAMLFITHDLRAAKEMAERTVVMKDGIVVEMGDTETIFSSPQHEYTKKLLKHIEYGSEAKASNAKAADRSVMLTIENLSKSFPVGRRGKIQVLKNFSMELHGGEVVGLVGESGCGKTTLARCIMGIDSPDSGEIIIGSKPETQGGINMQMIFQDSVDAFNDRMTVEEIIAEPMVIAEKLNIKTSKKNVRTAMEVAGLDYEELAGRKPYELSGGQRQRTAIARALITNPDILVADEPLTGLDVSAQAQIARLFRTLADEYGIAILFIAHDMRMIEHVSDRVVNIYSR